MKNELIFIPLLAQVLLTAIIWMVMYRTRIGEMRRKRIRPQALANTDTARGLLADVSGPAHNFSNLFEIPVLFYVATISIYVTELVSLIFITLLGLFVVLRGIHSIIHITTNRVIQRFYVYLVSTSVLWLIWVLFAWHLFIEA